MNLICKTVFGSHLYGTNTETSDRDFKGIFLPTPEEILLGRIPKTSNQSPKDDSRKNAPDELDCEFYSLHHFIRLALQGQTVAIDMLYTPAKLTSKSNTYGWIWDEIVANREKFLSKNMNAFVGYARGQAAKYSLKGERLNKLREFVSILDEAAYDDPLSCYWDQLPRDDERKNPQGIRELQIGGKWYGETTATERVWEGAKRMVARYGKRANSAADAAGIDWKALSHAVRVSWELQELLMTSNLVFPIEGADILKQIKKGALDIGQVQIMLDESLNSIEKLTKQSNLPEKADVGFWEQFIIKVVTDYLRKNT